jgi:hypothetical protein
VGEVVEMAGEVAVGEVAEVGPVPLRRGSRKAAVFS